MDRHACIRVPCNPLARAFECDAVPAIASCPSRRFTGGRAETFQRAMPNLKFRSQVFVSTVQGLWLRRLTVPHHPTPKWGGVFGGWGQFAGTRTADAELPPVLATLLPPAS